MKVTTETGIVLDSEYGLAPSLNNLIMKRKLINTMAFVALKDNVPEAYLLVVNNKPVFESTSFGCITAHIQMLTMDKNFDG